MSIFGTIMNKIFHHGQAAKPAAVSGVSPEAGAAAGSVNSGILAAATEMQATADAAVAAAGTAASTPSAPAQNVDVGAVLTQMAGQKGGESNWKTSIVDLLKLLDMDSSLNARKELANELNVHVGADGSAEENVALHKAVMQKLAENGGKVPDDLRG